MDKFNWIEDIINIETINKNVKIHSGSNRKNEWNNIIGITEDNKLIENTNSFITDYKNWKINHENMVIFQNNFYKIYDNIKNNYEELLQNNDFIYIEKSCFYLINPFYDKNVGHDISCLLNQLHIILNNNYDNVVIMRDYKNSNNFKLIEFLFPKNIEFIEIDYDKKYHFKELITPPIVIFNMYLHAYLIDKIINNIKYMNVKCEINKKIILMKTNRNKNIMLNYTCNQCELFLQNLEKHGYENIIPEKINIYELATILLNASVIITSEGCISYYNRIFFNKNAKIIYIGKNTGYIHYINQSVKIKLHIDNQLNDNDNEYNHIVEQILNIEKE